MIELLVIVAIIGTMLAVATGNIVAGMGNAELSAGGRTVMQLARHARTLALLKQRPCVITYVDGGPGEGRESKITLEVGGASESASVKSNIRHIDFSGVEADEDDGGDPNAKSELAELMDRVEESFKGLRLKVELVGSDGRAATERKGAISVFSNVDYLLQQGRAERESLNAGDESGDGDDAADGGGKASDALKEDPVPVIFETNGRAQAHRVILYRDGADPDRDGVKIKVDLFGKVEVEDDD